MIRLVCNVRSRRNARRPGDIDRLRAALDGHGVVHTTGSLDDLDRTAAELARACDPRRDVIAIYGGDGTLHHTASALLRHYRSTQLPVIAILPGGNLNTVARGLGLRRDRDAALRTLRWLVSTSNTDAIPVTRRPLVRIGNRYGFIFGNNIFYNFLAAYYRARNPQKWTAARLIVQLSASSIVGGALSRRVLAPFRGRVACDGEVYPHDHYLTVAASSVPEAGNGFRLFPHAVDGADKLATVAIHTTALGLTLELPRIYLGAVQSPARCVSTVAREIRIESEAPVGYTLDGELYVDGPVVAVSAGPQLAIACPPGRLAGAAP